VVGGCVVGGEHQLYAPPPRAQNAVLVAASPGSERCVVPMHDAQTHAFAFDHHIIDRQKKARHVRKIASTAEGHYDKRCAPQSQANALRHHQQARERRSNHFKPQTEDGRLHTHHHDQRAGRVRLHVRGLQLFQPVLGLGRGDSSFRRGKRWSGEWGVGRSAPYCVGWRELYCLN